MPPDRVELGVELLAHLEHAELSVAEALDRIEAITTNPRLQREILAEAESRGIVERDDETIRPTDHSYVSFESQVVTKEGDFDCRRCGTGLSTGHFVSFDSGDLGPFGSSCIRKVLGRD